MDVYSKNGVLINKLGITSQEELSNAERILTSKRNAELLLEPIKGKFDLKHLQAIHKHLFQDIYSWAGELRTVDIAKSNLFCLAQFIPNYAEEIFRNLESENCLVNLDKAQFVKRCAYYFCEINALHKI